MPFSSTLPVNNSQVSSAELRAQFNGLKDLVDAQAALIATQASSIDGLMGRMSDMETAMGAVKPQLPTFLTQPAVEAISANNVNGVPELAITISDPPTQLEVQAIYDKVNELLNGLYR